MLKALSFSEMDKFSNESKNDYVALFDDLIITETQVGQYITETFNSSMPNTYRGISKDKSGNEHQILLIMKKMDYDFLHETIRANYEMVSREIPVYKDFEIATRQQMDDLEKRQKKEIEKEINEIPVELSVIVGNKLQERKDAGYEYLSDSDIMDILEEAENRGINATRRMLHLLGVD